MSQKEPTKESVWFKLCAFLSLTDTEVLAESGRYDRMLAYAMVFRQLVTFAFTFLLFSYGVSIFLSPVAAYTVGFVFALTLFFLDQAIIGSDWALRNPFKRGLPIRQLFGLIPRLIYSLIIAIGLATLAEISLQSNAIDEQIQKDVAQNNQEYFSRMAGYENELDTTVNATENKIDQLQQEILQLRTAQEQIRNTDESYDEDTVGNSIDNYQVTLEELQRDQKNTINTIGQLNERLSKTRSDYQYWFNEAILERTGQDGRPPTEGPKYERAVKTYTQLAELIPVIEAEIEDTKARLQGIEANILATTDTLNDYQLKSNTLSEKATTLTINDERLNQLNADLQDQQLLLTQQIEDKQDKLQAFRSKLINDGLFYEQKTGMLVRYLALNKIHADPELGEAAVLFSWMLKIFFIAIELMPVIIKLFFSPFSFYSLKMYRKMHVALLEEQAKLDQATAAFNQRQRETGRTEPTLPTVTQSI
jgi:predicted  nucleic acid-binding Zn-ribbon protein